MKEYIVKWFKDVFNSEDMKVFVDFITLDDCDDINFGLTEKSTEDKILGINIFGIKCANETQVANLVEFQALEDVIEQIDGISLLTSSKKGYDSPLISICKSSRKSPSKSEKKSLLS